MKAERKNTTFSIRVTDDLISRIDETASMFGQSKAAVISSIIERFFDLGGSAQTLVAYQLKRDYQKLREISEKLSESQTEESQKESMELLRSLIATEKEFQELHNVHEGMELQLKKEKEKKTESRKRAVQRSKKRRND